MIEVFQHLMRLPSLKLPGEGNMTFVSAFCCCVFTKLLNLQKVYRVDTSPHPYSGGNDVVPIGDLVIQMRFLGMKNERATQNGGYPGSSGRSEIN